MFNLRVIRAIESQILSEPICLMVSYSRDFSDKESFSVDPVMKTLVEKMKPEAFEGSQFEMTTDFMVTCCLR